MGGAGSHSLNLAFKAFDLQALWGKTDGKETIRITTEISERCPESFPRCQIVHFDLPAHGAQPAAHIHWCNAWDTEIKRRGILTELEKTAGQTLKWAQGSWSPHSFLLIVGTKGKALTNFHNSVCQLLPEKDFPNAGGPPQRLPRSAAEDHRPCHARNPRNRRRDDHLPGPKRTRCHSFPPPAPSKRCLPSGRRSWLQSRPRH